MNRNVVVIATHADDEVLGCGGVIKKHSEHGDHVHIVVVTKGSPEVYSQEQVDRIRSELVRAGEILGVTSIDSLGFPAPRLDTVPQHILAEAIRKSIEKVGAEWVYLPHHGDIHFEHKLAHAAALVACRPSNTCRVNRLMTYETLSETEWAIPIGDHAFIPTMFVEITDQLQAKLDAMSAYQSQLKEFPHCRSLDSIKALSRIRGGTIGVPCAEAFSTIRDIVDLE